MELVFSSLILIGLSVVLASSFNLIIGYAGLLSIAHPVFYALGAYTSALLATRLGLPVPFAILCGALMAGGASLAVSLPSLRVSGDYLVIASIGFQLGVLQIIKNLEFTGGPGGLSNIKPLMADYSPAAQWATIGIVWLLAGLTIGLTRWLVGGDYGRAITGMRDDEEAFQSLGRSAMHIKVTLFAIACGLAGLAGGIYAHQFLFLSPDQFDIIYSAAILTMVVVGGIRTIWGPVLGAVLLYSLPLGINFLDLPSSVTGPLQGLIFTGMVIFFLFARPQGLLGPSRTPSRPVVTLEEDIDQAIGETPGASR